MQISFNRIKPEKITRKEVREAIKFAAPIIMTPQMLRNITIKAIFEPLGKDWGLCDYDDNDIPTRPRNFSIYLEHTAPRYMTLRTLFHEMWHIKQYATGEMKDCARMVNKVKWRGKTIPFNSDDFETPPERAARRMENKLYKMYKERKV